MNANNKDTFTHFFKDTDCIPVYREIDSTYETPASNFLKTGGSFLLESVSDNKNSGRYSIIGKGKAKEFIINRNTITIKTYKNRKLCETVTEESLNPFEIISEFLDSIKIPSEFNSILPPFYGGLIGYIGYECIKYFEKTDNPVQSEFPDSILILPEFIIIHDSVKNSIFIVKLVIGTESLNKRVIRAKKEIDKIAEEIRKPLTIPHEYYTENTYENRTYDKAEFTDTVKKIKKHIVTGDIIQAVISRKIKIPYRGTSYNYYSVLRKISPSPYMFLLDMDDFAIIGSSPETMVRLNRDELTLKPIAGTEKISGDPVTDRILAEKMLNNKKERAEHIMLVDLGRNDLGRVSERDSVKVSKYMKAEYFSHVMHLVSTIKSTKEKDKSIMDVIASVFPAGTLTGAPKIKAVNLINRYEKEPRGPYGGMILYTGFNQTMDSCITIRSAVLKNNELHIQAGAGIVADSDPEKEFCETVNKTAPLIEAAFYRGETNDTDN